MAAVESHKSSEADMKSYFVLCETCLLLESTIKHEIAPEALNSICAENISENLKDQFAFLSGGQGKDGAVIITFPEYPNFGDISEEVVQKIVTYLTTIPSLHQPEIKFIFILDRRQDTWGSIKTSLAHIAASCPENLQLVLVLRPSGFFQRAISDISFRFSHDDFILKLPVVMLSSVTELLKYIDDTHLTQEYGGTLEYCHNEWILFRTAIESFAVMVKEIAQMLQSFGTDLAEAELPDDLHFVEDLLIARTEKYNQLKEDVRRVIKEGELLLTNLMEPLSNEPHTQDGVEKNDDRATVKRLLAQLHEMETAFDGFWEKHLLKLEQCLQLWRFEQAFQEVKMIVDCLAAEEGDIPETGDNVAHTEQALRELSNLDERSQELVENAQHLVFQGDHLISNHHYAMDLIWEKCNELHHSCEDLCDEMRRKFITLNRSLELHTRLQQALDWCDQGTYLLASQSMDKCQSQEGAKRVLQEIERFLENSTYYLQRDTEALYIEFQSILTSRLKAQIEVVHEKLENVHGMFEKRQTCLEKLAAKQARPVQPVAPRPDTSPLQYKSPLFSSKQGADTNPSPKFPFDISLYGKKHVKKNQNTRKIEVMHEACQRPWFSSSVEGEDNLDVLKGHVINELIETERVYVEELHTILQGYRVEMDNPSMLHLLPSVLQNKKEILFGNMSEIHDFHSRMFLHDLQNCIETPEKVGLCFLARKANFQMYVKYCQNKPRSEALWRQCSDSFFFQECQRKLDHKLALDSYLLKPIQRLTKYQLLLKELLKFCNGDGIQDLQEALEAMLNLLKCVNDSMHQIAITGYNGNLEDFGRVLMQGSFNVWINHKKGPTKMKDLARFKPMHRHLFLHERALLFCKKREEHGEGYDKAPSYSFKHYLKMSAVGITENVKGDIKKFEVWYSGREEVYLIQAPTVDVKLAWLNEIRKVLTNQEKLSREDSTLHHQVSDQILLSPGKQKRASLSSEENDSDLPSPVVLENIVFSPNLSPRKDWAGTSRFTEASEGNDDLSSNNDTEEEDVNQLSPGKYKTQSDCKKGDSEELLIKRGDPVQLVNEDGEGQWFVKNLNRGQQAWISVHNLQIIVGDCKSQGPGSSETLQFEQSQDIT